MRRTCSHGMWFEMCNRGCTIVHKPCGCHEYVTVPETDEERAERRASESRSLAGVLLLAAVIVVVGLAGSVVGYTV